MPEIILAGEDHDVKVDTRQIKRVRYATDSEVRESHATAKSRIDYTQPLYVKNAPQAVLAVIGADAAEAKLFGKLTMQDGNPVWFRGPNNALGPVPISDGVRRDGINAALRIAGKLQFVRETPKKVLDVIEAAGGSTVADLQSTITSEADATAFEQELNQATVWDFDVPELKLPTAKSDR